MSFIHWVFSGRTVAILRSAAPACAAANSASTIAAAVMSLEYRMRVLRVYPSSIKYMKVRVRHCASRDCLESPVQDTGVRNIRQRRREVRPHRVVQVHWSACNRERLDPPPLPRATGGRAVLSHTAAGRIPARIPPLRSDPAHPSARLLVRNTPALFRARPQATVA